MNPGQVPARLRRPLLLVLLALVGALALSPNALSLSNGAHKETVQDPAFQDIGCAACHGPADHSFPPLDLSQVEILVANKETGEPLNGPYEPDAVYQITIALQEQVAADGGATGNHAGFNLRASAGTLAGVDGISQATADGTQATHVGADRVNWTMDWTAPHEGAAAFRLFVNDVDGDGSNSVGDMVYQLGFWFPDPEGSEVGAAAEEAHVEFGITLQQYWIGLIGLAGMLFIMIAGYVYLKYANPHHTGPKDR